MELQGNSVGTVVYLAGPMSGVVDYNRPAFNAVSARLNEAGCVVFNPAAEPDGLSELAYMQIAMARLPHATQVICLPGWELSEGAKTEVSYAKKLAIPTLKPDYACMLKHARKQIAMTQEEAADIYGVCLSQYKYYENGHTKVTYETAKAIIEQVFNVDMNAAFTSWVSDDSPQH